MKWLLESIYEMNCFHLLIRICFGILLLSITTPSYITIQNDIINNMTGSSTYLLQQTLKLISYQTLFNVVITRYNTKSHKNKALTYEDNAHNNLMVMLMVVSAALKKIFCLF